MLLVCDCVWVDFSRVDRCRFLCFSRVVLLLCRVKFMLVVVSVMMDIIIISFSKVKFWFLWVWRCLLFMIECFGFGV